MSSHRELPKQKACMSAQSVDSRLDTSDKYAPVYALRMLRGLQHVCSPDRGTTEEHNFEFILLL